MCTPWLTACQEAAPALGRVDAEWGEAVIARVVVRDGADGDDRLAAELRSFCSGRLAAFKAPKTIEFVTEIPRGPTGKLQRHALRDQRAIRSQRHEPDRP